MPRFTKTDFLMVLAISLVVLSMLIPFIMQVRRDRYPQSGPKVVCKIIRKYETNGSLFVDVQEQDKPKIQTLQIPIYVSLWGRKERELYANLLEEKHYSLIIDKGFFNRSLIIPQIISAKLVEVE